MTTSADTRPLGVCTWTFGDRPLADIAARLRKLGFDGVELMGELEAYTPAEAAAILGDHGLEVFSLTPANVDLAHPDRTTRKRAVDYYLRLLDFAAALGNPLVSCHGYVGRIRPLADLEEELVLLGEAVTQIAKRAAELGLRLVWEVLNRYESHLLCTASDALEFIQSLEADNLGLLLDAYHMNIEEPDPTAALRRAGSLLWLYHAADSNRQAIGRGHTDFAAQFMVLDEIGYRGPIILECTAPGPDPFVPIKDAESLQWLETYLRESRQQLITFSSPS
ncbi:MAG: sugar phosphate isomerase/epimerase [Caldilineae bacterium]|nr:MAG: sugar phosphate isomerase/epimerase [Caldilineae bacterium]